MMGRLMTKYDRELYRIKAIFCKTLADSKRQMMITELRSGEKTVGQIAEIIEISQPTASHHLAILREAGVVKARREGSSIYYSLATPKIAEACDIVQEIILNQMAKNKEFADRMMS
jgi:ArsR family transcriptional regulator, virulence genes transcriptional regulator